MTLIENQGRIQLSTEDVTGLLVAKYGEASYYLSNPPNKDLYPKLIQGEGARPGIGIQGWLAVAADTKDGRGVVVQKYTFTNATTSRPLTTYRAYGFDLLTGEIIGAYNYQGNFIPNAELTKPDTSDLVPGIRLAYTNNEQAIFAEIDSWLQKFDAIINPNSSSSGNTEGRHSQESSIQKPSKFNKKSADKITNFNPSNDTLEIDTDSFGIDSSASFAAGKNMKAVKKKLANKDFDFLYDEKKGGLYFNENGADKGFGDGGLIAILKGAPDLTMDNIDFV